MIYVLKKLFLIVFDDAGGLNVLAGGISVLSGGISAFSATISDTVSASNAGMTVRGFADITDGLAVNTFGGKVIISQGMTVHDAGMFVSNGMTINGNNFIAGGVFIFSDERMKENVVPIHSSDALHQVRKLRSVYFTWKNQTNDKEKNIDSIDHNNDTSRDHTTERDYMRSNDDRSIGFIAQEMRKIIPEIVTADNEYNRSNSGANSDEYMGLDGITGVIKDNENVGLKELLDECVDSKREDSRQEVSTHTEHSLPQADNYLAIRYVELLPLLLESIKDLHHTIVKLKDRTQVATSKDSKYLSCKENKSQSTCERRCDLLIRYQNLMKESKYLESVISSLHVE